MRLSPAENLLALRRRDLLSRMFKIDWFSIHAACAGFSIIGTTGGWCYGGSPLSRGSEHCWGGVNADLRPPAQVTAKSLSLVYDHY